jgi:hypothetical protein
MGVLYYLGNNDKEKVCTYSAGWVFFPNIFDPPLVDSVDTEPMDMEE